MKTPQEWLDSEQWHETGDKEILEQIAAIQKDARIKGMEDAAKICYDSVATIVKPSEIGPLHAVGMGDGMKVCHNEILAASLELK